MKLLPVIISIFLVTALLPEAQVHAEGIVETAHDNTLIREGPGLSYPAVTSADEGDRFTELQRVSGWVQVSLAEGSGWIADWLLTETETSTEPSDSESAAEPASDNNNGTILVDRLNVRDDFSSEGNVIGTLNTGDQVTISDEKYGWLNISTGTLTGWVSSDYVEYNIFSAVESSDTLTDDIHITVNGLQVRAEPDRNGEIIGTVNLYDSFTVEEESEGWLMIEFEDGQTGWIAEWFTERGLHPGSAGSGDLDGQVTILYNGSNIRMEPSTDAAVLYKAGAGESLEVTGETGDWYEVLIPGGERGYIANWIVSAEDGTSPEEELNDEPVESISDATIVIDAGHGGRDGGAIGAAGTLEKSLTIRTAEALYHMLSSTGANVIMTREDDRHVDLHSRVAVSKDHGADAFISLHYDAINDRSVKGFTTYFYGGPDEALADSVHSGLSDSMTIKNRGMHHGNFLVLRDNSAPSVLIELGFISNPSEEASVNNERFREIAATGIYNGLTDYFSGGN
ncbi:N-acetylmuramoyl-L-alanine amidase [Jeotgalibacillus terrae]|uniref:N-acetylmuramoyl-L-alanine amidase n=1 Tax=Jeotgalibacillus terrae TaxID=587735 RepID=A0ABW5ZHW4_9BACL|nr:N-acetylmuramoyl-L-alanine amidase [Jeotgalibacillus terrae]MBM7578795.1 N-acetylmuramoyl-L-alanine amidase [Jeotgalibacillus terrae]